MIGEGIVLGNGEFFFFGVDGKIVVFNGSFRLGFLVMVFIFLYGLYFRGVLFLVIYSLGF